MEIVLWRRMSHDLDASDYKKRIILSFCTIDTRKKHGTSFIIRMLLNRSQGGEPFYDRYTKETRDILHHSYALEQIARGLWRKKRWWLTLIAKFLNPPVEKLFMKECRRRGVKRYENSMRNCILQIMNINREMLKRWRIPFWRGIPFNDETHLCDMKEFGHTMPNDA